MADSDEEYDRRRGRDKFRRERSDYDRREDRRGREPWEDRGGRDGWSSKSRDRRDPYGRDYDRGRRDQYSPPHHDMSPPPMKRMRHDWDPPYEMPYGGGGGGGHNMHGPPRYGNWGPGPQDMGNMPPNQGHFGGPRDVDYPTQAPMMSFKHFLSQQDDNISDDDAIKKYSEYKLEYRKQQINEFFLAHKDEEWFKSKYHPEECGKRKEESRNALTRRLQVYLTLIETTNLQSLSCELDKSDELTKLLDAAVILMEGGTESDLKVLDQADPTEKNEDGSRSRTNSESQPTPEKRRTEDKEKSNLDVSAEAASPKKKRESVNSEKHEDKKADEEETEEGEEKAEQEEEEEEASEDEEEASEDEDVRADKKKKRHRDRSEYSSESSSESESASDSESEQAPPTDNKPRDFQDLAPSFDGANDEKPEENEAAPDNKPAEKEEGEEEEEKEQDTVEKAAEEEEVKPRPYHKTCSIFLRNLAPTITKQEVEAMCKRYPGFMRVALQDPQPERRFFRRGWVTFDRSVNIKDICWNLNNIRLRDCEMGAIVNRELKQRVRPVNGITSHRQVVKSDVKHAAKIVQKLDTKWGLWEDADDEKKNEEKQLSFGLVSKNPVLKNITEYLVEEGSYEEEELLGEAIDDKPKETNPEIQIERDETLLKVLDRMILYLRIVHSFDYYSAVEYPNEDEMPHRCGIMHARGPNPPNRLTQNDVNEWIKNFGNKISTFTELQVQLSEEEAAQLGKKNPEAEVEKFVVANTQELSKDKWLCPLSGKKFKGPEFIRKHIFNKHGEKVEEVKEEVAFFNNYLLDPKRPQLPPHPGSKQGGPVNQNNIPPQAGGGGSAGGGFQGPSQQGMMGYNQHRPPMMSQGRYGNDRSFGRSGPFGGSSQYGRPDSYRHDNRRRDTYMMRGGRDRQLKRRLNEYRPDPRRIIEYRDLDAPDDVDMF